MLEQLLDWDVTLFLYLNGLGTSFFDPFWMLMTHKATNFAVYLVLLFWFYRFKGVETNSFFTFKCWSVNPSYRPSHQSF